MINFQMILLYPQLFLEEALYYEKDKTFKTDKQKHYVCIATSNRMMELVLAKSEKKRNRTNFYW